MQKYHNSLERLYRFAGAMCRNVWKISLCFMFLYGGLAITQAQDDRPPVINAENIEQLQSVAQIDFIAFEAQGILIKNGRFALRDDGQRFAITDTLGTIYILDEFDLFDASYDVSGADGLSADPLEIAFGLDSDIASIHTDGNQFYVVQFNYETQNFRELPFDEVLLDLWWSESSLRVETENSISAIADDELEILSQTFKEDAESIIRIGRIEPPLAVTVTEDGRVKRWNMETGEITAEVQINGALPIYGQMNAGGDHYLVWRDPQSEALHLLDLESGDDQIVVALDGTYIPFIFLTADADVIIGVHVDEEPIVVAWDVETGEQYELGEYRQCNRPPDMVRLSTDGTTLVIGCDTGLDIWRVGSH